MSAVNVDVRTYTLPPDVTKKIDEAAAETGLKKSTIVSIALQQWLATREGAKTMDQLGIAGGSTLPTPTAKTVEG